MYAIFTYIWVFVAANVGKYSIHGAYGTVEFSNRNHICEDCQIAYCGAQGSNRFNRFTARAGATRSACSNTCGAGTAERQATRRMWDGCPEMERNTVKTSILGCSLPCTQDVFFWQVLGKVWKSRILPDVFDIRLSLFKKTVLKFVLQYDILESLAVLG